jgi:fatty acid desaturase
MKKHVLTYSVANNTKASLAIALSFFFEAVSILLFRMEYNTIACIFRGFVLIRMFVQLHDMAHFSFFSNITVNRIVGKFFGIYTHYPFNAWRDGHNHHHKHFGNLDRSDVSQTILFTKKEWESMKGIKKIVVRILR